MRPCSRGLPGIDGNLCPYIAHEPLSDAGWQTWDVLTRCTGQLRIAPHGLSVIGIDFNAALRLGDALGHDLYALAELLPAGEAGLVKVLNEQSNRGDVSDGYSD
jgi:hypothetical protein